MQIKIRDLAGRVLFKPGGDEIETFKGYYFENDMSLAGADLAGYNLENACLEGAYLVGANLSGANLHGAQMQNANLSNADVSGVDMRGADLTGVTWCGANIDGIILHPSSISGPGHILYALTDLEAGVIKAMRGNDS